VSRKRGGIEMPLVLFVGRATVPGRMLWLVFALHYQIRFIRVIICNTPLWNKNMFLRLGTFIFGRVLFADV